MLIKKAIKQIVPKSILNLRHLFYAWLGAVKYHHPSDKLLVIGITGTSGKSSTAYLLRQLLEQLGFKVGALSTIEFSISGISKLNNKKMTMLGKTEIQRYLSEMVKTKCDVAIIETTSEGFLQHRHRFINYDMILLANLYPEHIEAHGGFENYKAAKLGLFAYVSKCRAKNKAIPKTCIINRENEYAMEFAGFKFDKKLFFGRADKVGQITIDQNILTADEIMTDVDGLHFSVGEEKFNVPMYGEHNIMNILAVLTVAKAMQLDKSKVKAAVESFQGIPGRIEFIPEAESRGFKVIVDYAFEPEAVKELYKLAWLFGPTRIIHVFGATGGGRDKSRRVSVGELVGKNADICIVTDEDPYDDDPLEIIDEVASAAIATGKKDGQDLFKILNRSEAIKVAIDIAQENDIVLITGKGSEQAMMVNDRLLPWDDRAEVRKALRRTNDE